MFSWNLDQLEYSGADETHEGKGEGMEWPLTWHLLALLCAKHHGGGSDLSHI